MLTLQYMCTVQAAMTGKAGHAAAAKKALKKVGEQDKVVRKLQLDTVNNRQVVCAYVAFNSWFDAQLAVKHHSAGPLITFLAKHMPKVSADRLIAWTAVHCHVSSPQRSSGSPPYHTEDPGVGRSHPVPRAVPGAGSRSGAVHNSAEGMA